MPIDRSLPSPNAGPASARLQSIDALRGLVILFMLLDHVRETFFLHHQVSDPMVVAATSPDLFASRLLAHVCAPVFVFLTGLSACLYGSRQGGGRGAASVFLLQRGFFLVALELTLVNFAWTFQWPPQVVYLQVIWVIGLSMLALAALLWLPRTVLIALGVVIVAGHNLLDGLHFPVGHALHIPWAVLHDRGWIEVGESLRLRTSYPLLPWIGVIALGYAAGPWFLASTDAGARQRRLLAWGTGLLAGFAVLRWWNVYGDKPWVAGDTALATAMSFLNVTKYPPSLLFVALTLGVGLLVLRAFERARPGAGLRVLAGFGAAPMFFYLLHLYVLKLLYLAAVAVWGKTQGAYFGFDAMWAVWLCTAVLAVALYPAVKAFGAFKARRRDIAWLKYL
ncbi:DUF1624 domain-containing protein [Acidovorax sp. SUPP3434]|uniref:DUF1624 domain-containing protein n=1 Tax=Acidovorax sp. SUPP3434 TaxID=2920880 RepID=UPI0023DE3B39|nr:heparan-alpha-glucosaminide N-acetyltransferase domain-containing protein [Acidovorax sp. SUPP3434]GKT00324.1 DUF1624 domain-containing protein [Acidovorax sp. SUPP3434]